MYLYIFEDGRMTQKEGSFTEEDVAAVADGYLTIVKFEDGKFFDMKNNDGEGVFEEIEDMVELI